MPKKCKIPNPSPNGSIFNIFVRRCDNILNFFGVMHYNISTVSLCATKATVWEYSYAVFLLYL